jgi:hypothetical protein
MSATASLALTFLFAMNREPPPECGSRTVDAFPGVSPSHQPKLCDAPAILGVIELYRPFDGPSHPLKPDHCLVRAFTEVKLPPSWYKSYF